MPDIVLEAPEYQLRPLSYRTPGRPQPNPRLLYPNPGESGGSPDTMRLVFLPTEVDELPEMVEELHPRYPDGLHRAGVSGLVQLQYLWREEMEGWTSDRLVQQTIRFSFR